MQPHNRLNKYSTENPKKRFDLEKGSYIATIFSSFSVIVAMMTLLFSIYPQLIWKNANYFEKANAGDVYSQLFLANHYYEIGEYGESIYWYKIASTAENSKYSSVACNNLGYLYANGYGFSGNSEEVYRLEKALLLFEQGAKQLDASNDNIRTLLKASSKESFPSISSRDFENLLAQYNVESLVESVSYEYFEISRGPIFWKDNKKYVGGQYVDASNGRGYYVYRVYTYAKQSNTSEEKYIYISIDKTASK